MKKILELAPRLAEDVVLIAGIVLLSYGAFQMYSPAGYMTLGLCLIALAFLMAKRTLQ